MTGEVAKLLEVDIGTVDEVNAILEQAQETLLFASVRAEQEAEQVRESNTLLEEQHRALRDEAQRDKLTKLYNRERFDDYLGQEFKRALTGTKPMSLLFCDVDHFKKVNDTLGIPRETWCWSPWPSSWANACGRKTSRFATEGKNSCSFFRRPIRRGRSRWPNASSNESKRPRLRQSRGPFG